MRKKSHYIIILSIILTISLSACGSKKSVLVNSPKDLKGLKVGCQLSTTADDSLKKLSKAVKFEVKKYNDIISTFADLKTGRLDAVVVDEVVARDYIKKNPKNFKITKGKLTNEPIGVCFKKNNTAYRNKINALIDDFKKDGTLKSISKKWFGEDITTNINNINSANLQGISDSSYQVPADKKKFIVGVDNTYPPMEYMDGNKNIGFDIDFANAIAKKLNLELKVVPTAWDGIFAALKTDKFDCIISSVSINDDRLNNFALSKPYIANAQVIVTRSK